VIEGGYEDLVEKLRYMFQYPVSSWKISILRFIMVATIQLPPGRIFTCTAFSEAHPENAPDVCDQLPLS
jgi:hypothetical protein